MPARKSGEASSRDGDPAVLSHDEQPPTPFLNMPDLLSHPEPEPNSPGTQRW